jgi:hypothetical protein
MGNTNGGVRKRHGGRLSNTNEAARDENATIKSEAHIRPQPQF